MNRCNRSCRSAGVSSCGRALAEPATGTHNGGDHDQKHHAERSPSSHRRERTRARAAALQMLTRRLQQAKARGFELLYNVPSR